MEDEEFKALVDDARKECNHVDNEKMRYGDEGLTALHGVMVYVAENYPTDSLKVRAARGWIKNRANEWRARNENSN